MKRLWPWALSWVLVLLLPGCPAGTTGADTRRYACREDDECAPGFVCRAGMCQGEPGPTSPLGDAGTSDAGTSDAGDAPKSGRLGFTSPGQSVDTDQCSAAVGVETQTLAGDAVSLETATTISLSAEPTQGLNFFRDSTCATPITAVTVAAGSRAASFYFRGSAAQPVQLTVAASGFESATQTETLRAVPTSVVFFSGAQRVQAGACSGAVVLEARDAGNRPITLTTARNVKLEGAELLFYADSACTTPLTNSTFVFAVGEPRHSFYFKGRSGGSIDVRASVQNLAAVSQTQTVLPVVRASTCTMATDSTTVTCDINPPQTDRSKTLLLFQVSPNGSTPASGLVRCSLRDTATLACERNSTGNGAVNISWQTVELRTGLRVQHLQASAPGTSPYVRVPLDTQVNPAKSFLLVSHQVSGSLLGEAAFSTAKLNTAGTQVEYQFSVNASSSWKGSLQVVEMDGIQVTRGTSTFPGTQTTVSNLSAVDLSSSVLLSTHRVSNAGTANECDRMLRGDLTSSTGIEFSRGSGNGSTKCTTAVIDEIAWERIQFGSLARVQTVQAYMEWLKSNNLFPLAPAVDTTRSVAFASSQSMNGQAGGETYLDGDDVLAEPLAAFTFSSSSQLAAYRNGGTFAKWTSYVVQFEP